MDHNLDKINKFTLTNTDIHKIDLAITDEDFNYINFNNINWSIIFSLHITYNTQMNIPIIPDDNNISNPKKSLDNQNLIDLNFLNS